MTKLPAISLVVPNYNGGKTLEATLRSVIDQNYPNLELIVMDGGSKDNSIEIIKKYEKSIACWESVRDRGQSHAINKGFARCTGEVVNWLCSDDFLLPGALETVGRIMADPRVDLCIGACQLTLPDDPSQNRLWAANAEQVKATALWNLIPQSSCFFRKRLLDREPPVRENLHYAMDQELWCYFLEKGARWVITEQMLSEAVQDGNNKTRTADFRKHIETDYIWRRYAKGAGQPRIPRWYRVGVRWSAIYLERHPRGMWSGIAGGWIHLIGWAQRTWRRRTRLRMFATGEPSQRTGQT